MQAAWTMKVFFYGLFMDTALLADKGIIAGDAVTGHIDGFRLCIGRRATLLRADDAQTYGIVAEISPQQAEELYSEDSVSDYVAQPVFVTLTDGRTVEATSYILPRDQITAETNLHYAKALYKVAKRLGLPSSYLVEIERAGQ